MNILVITYWKFEDALIQTYTLPYLKIIRNILPQGSSIFLVTLEENGASTELKDIGDGIYRFSFPLHPFGLKAILGWKKNLRHLRGFVKERNISFIHTWCTPAGAIGYLLSKDTGVPLVLDSYEPHAEPMVETGTWNRFGPAFRILFRLERKQSRHALWRIGVVEKMREYSLEKYGCNADNFLVKPACIDTTLFQPQKKREALRAQLGFNDEVVCLYAGKFGGLYLTVEVFNFFKEASAQWKNKFRVLLLTSARREEIESLCAKAGVDPSIVHSLFVPHNWVPKYMEASDFAISPFKPVPSRRYCTPIKNGEYWAMGLPVVIPAGISDDSDIIRDNNAGYVLQDLDSHSYRKAAQAINHLLENENREQRIQRIRSLAEKHRTFAIAETVYRTIYG